VVAQEIYNASRGLCFKQSRQQLKKRNMKGIIRSMSFLLMATLLSFLSFAQEKGVDVNINVNKKSSDWYQQPWVWIVGGAVFILLLVALLRGGGKKE
jgi:ABC-type dipeptide/oligopeptide/nickel transport system permease subunit